MMQNKSPKILISLLCFFYIAVASAENSSSPERPWLRSDSGMSHIKRNRDMSYIAYVPPGDTGIRVIEVKSGNIFEASDAFSGGSYFWSPDNARLFFRELINKNGKVSTRVRAWDSSIKKTVDVESIDGSSGLLSFDPRDQRMSLMHDKGIMSKRLVFPDERLAYWQSSLRNDKGKYVAAASGMTFITQQGFAMAKLSDDDTGIQSFDISAQGDQIVWATKYGRIYVSKQGEAPTFIDFGKDPQWHPEKELIVYAGARMVGNKASSYDVKVSNLHSRGSFITTTQEKDERWPIWTPKGDAIIYTVTGTTDLTKVAFGKGN